MKIDRVLESESEMVRRKPDILRYTCIESLPRRVVISRFRMGVYKYDPFVPIGR
jgi:hypothetical protein